MITFNQYLVTESIFDKQDYSKHDYKYPLAVINDLLGGKQLKIKSGDTISLADFDKDALIKIRDDITNTTADDFNKAYKQKVGNTRSIWANIQKSPYSGSSADKKVPGAEAAVLIYLDILVNRGDINDIANYKPSKRFFTDQKYIDDAIGVMQTDASWQKSALQTARNIIKQFPKIQSYNIYYRDKQYNKLREIGNKLGNFGGQLDRWNPADVFFAKPGAVPIKSEHTGNITDYNAYIGACEDVIGISLKKADNQAMHGSVSLGNMLKQLPGIKTAMQKYKSVSETFDTVHKQLKTIQQQPIADIVYCVGEGSDIHNRIISGNRENVKLNNGTFINSVPNVLQFIVSGGNDKPTFEDAVKLCYLWAASRTPISCSHYKASATGCKFVDCKTAIEFKLERVIIPLNGNSRIQFDIDVDGNKWSLIARSKQEAAYPQFVIEHKRPRALGAKPINNVKF